MKFATAGSVDDGKSTLIGRLIYDSHSLFDDQLAALLSDRQSFNLALLTDGLREEREKSITIDVAYRYFESEKCKFIVCDSPGHAHFTRNMVTAVSACEAVVVLIDAHHGVVDQTKKHLQVISLMKVPQVIICVNKMDAFNYSREVFQKIIDDVNELWATHSLTKLIFIPVSALQGDNIVHKSKNLPWYRGDSLLQTLENLSENHRGKINLNLRLPIQTVISQGEFVGYAGLVTSGETHLNDEIVILPSGEISKITGIYSYQNKKLIPKMKAQCGESTLITLKNSKPLKRGDLIISAQDKKPPLLSSHFTATLFWFDEQSSNEKKKYNLSHSTQNLEGITFKTENHKNLTSNDIAQVEIKIDDTLWSDRYDDYRDTGSFILIDPETSRTVAAGVVA